MHTFTAYQKLMSVSNTLLSEATQYASQWYLSHGRPELTFHNMALSNQLSQRIEEIGEGQQLAPNIIANAQVAALFSQMGYALQYDQAVEASRDLLQAFLSNKEMATEEKRTMVDCMVPHQISDEAMLFQDAWNSTVFGDGMEIYLPLYRSEMQFVRRASVSKSVARGWFYSQIKKARLQTNFAKAKYQGILSENIANLERLVNKNLAKQAQTEQLFGGVTASNPSREVQTYFRTSFDYHTKLIDISDNKARIMISVNSILVSILISLLTYKYQRVASTINPMVIVPILIFLIAAVGSLIFAILSSRPNFPTSTPQKHENLFSFMDFVKLGKAAYQNQMDLLLRDGASILSSMTAALFFLGEILDKKYKYLTISYNIFMVGFVVSVVMFMITYFL